MITRSVWSTTSSGRHHEGSPSPGGFRMHQQHSRHGARTAFALGAALVLVLTGCTDAGTGSKTGGKAEPVVLTLADGYSNPDYEPAVRYFVQRVAQLSGGQVAVKDEQGWGDLKPGYEQQIIADVAAGKADLGWVGTRAFDTLGITSFQALTAPMLIDSYPLEDAVIGSELPAQMLTGLGPVHVTGLAILGDGLRKPIAKQRPLTSPSDWKGLSFQLFRSKAGAAAVAATGAEPTDDVKADYQAAERNLRIYRENYLKDFRYVTANVNLWPQTLALLGNPARLGRLTDQQQGWVQAAAKDAAARSTAFFDHDQDLVKTSCDRGARFANASTADLSSLRATFAGVYADLERDPTTRTFVARINAMKRTLPTSVPLAIPADCDAALPGASGEDRLQGTWTSKALTEADIVHAFVAAGGAEAEGHAMFVDEPAKKSVTFQLRFQNGSLDAFDRGDSGPFVHSDARSYLLKGDVVTFSTPGCIATYRVQLNADTLRLRPIAECPGHDHPYGVTIYGSFPFTRSG